jgi:succinyl-diaminopimelate desuccinylase
VSASSPLVRRLSETGGFRLEPKQAWTPVAPLTHQRLHAVNLGPGATEYAHTKDERVAILELARTYEALQRFIARVP